MGYKERVEFQSSDSVVVKGWAGHKEGIWFESPSSMVKGWAGYKEGIGSESF